MSEDLDLEPQEPVFFAILVAFVGIAGFLGFLLGTAFPQIPSNFTPISQTTINKESCK